MPKISLSYPSIPKSNSYAVEVMFGNLSSLSSDIFLMGEYLFLLSQHPTNEIQTIITNPIDLLRKLLPIHPIDQSSDQIHS